MGVLREKIHTLAILKENTASCISLLESLINVDFGGKNELPVVCISQKEITNNPENDRASFN